MSVAFLIPIRGFTSSMSRLRENLPNGQVNKIVKHLFIQTIEAIQGFDHDIIIATTDKNLPKLYDDVKFVFDDGEDLNVAIDQVVSTYDYRRYFLVMPDLPALTSDHIGKILRLSELHENVIVPTSDHGTACAILPTEFYKTHFLGTSSGDKILEYARDHEIPLAKIEIKKLLLDLDTIDDYNYWKAQIEQFIEMGYH